MPDTMHGRWRSQGRLLGLYTNARGETVLRITAGRGGAYVALAREQVDELLAALQSAAG